MSESTNKYLVGQPIFTQVLALVNKNDFNGLVKMHETDRYCKKFTIWAHFVSIMFGIYSRCDSVIEIVEGMIGCVGKQGHFGLSEVPPKSTITDGNRERDSKFFDLLRWFMNWASKNNRVLGNLYREIDFFPEKLPGEAPVYLFWEEVMKLFNQAEERQVKQLNVIQLSWGREN